MSTNLVDALIEEMRRVRDEILPAYVIAISKGWEEVAQTKYIEIRETLNGATRALADADVVDCLRYLEKLRGYHT